jgi:hypothetical protein
MVKTSYFPNWEVHGARGPWRLAPNLMVVVPTSKDVKLTYGLTTGDRAGRVLTLVGLLGIVALVKVRALRGRVDDGDGDDDGEPGDLAAVASLEPGRGYGEDDDDDGEPGGEPGRPDEVPALP